MIRDCSVYFYDLVNGIDKHYPNVYKSKCFSMIAKYCIYYARDYSNDWVVETNGKITSLKCIHIKC